jgi:hypothetical protein
VLDAADGARDCPDRASVLIGAVERAMHTALAARHIVKMIRP